MAMKVSYHIDAPVKTVFDYFKDPSSDDGSLGMEVLEAKMTDEGIGTYVNWRLRIAGVPLWEAFEVITDLVPNKHITEKSSNAMVGTWDYWFTKEGSGTKVTVLHRPRSIWALPPLSNLVDYGTTRMSKVYFGHVKAKLETQAQTHPQTKAATPKPRKAAS